MGQCVYQMIVDAGLNDLYSCTSVTGKNVDIELGVSSLDMVLPISCESANNKEEKVRGSDLIVVANQS